jgi:predicted secreted protein
MGWITGAAVYLVLWWLVIFAVLPWGVKPIDSNDRGFEPGAPQNPHLLRKIVITTIVTTIIWGLFVLIATSDLISFRQP